MRGQPAARRDRPGRRERADALRRRSTRSLRRHLREEPRPADIDPHRHRTIHRREHVGAPDGRRSSLAGRSPSSARIAWSCATATRPGRVLLIDGDQLTLAWPCQGRPRAIEHRRRSPPDRQIFRRQVAGRVAPELHDRRAGHVRSRQRLGGLDDADPQPDSAGADGADALDRSLVADVEDHADGISWRRQQDARPSTTSSSTEPSIRDVFVLD